MGGTVSGFPAHAGMVPWFAVPAKTIEGFPRPRGDGPVILVFISSQCAVSPPTRGWSCHMIVCTLLGDGFPAHAGMVPLFCLHGSGDVRFPRPRGDPPTRGWSQAAMMGLFFGAGFPAHAGMVPSRSERSRDASGFPRRMVPRHASGPIGAPRFPRPRGDGPVSQFTKSGSSMVSPPTRGWSRR